MIMDLFTWRSVTGLRIGISSIFCVLFVCTPNFTIIVEHLDNERYHIASCLYDCQLAFSAILYLFIVITNHDMFLSTTSVKGRDQCELPKCYFSIREQASYLVANWLHWGFCFFPKINSASIFSLLDKWINLNIDLPSLLLRLLSTFSYVDLVIFFPATSHNIAFDESVIV